MPDFARGTRVTVRIVGAQPVGRGGAAPPRVAGLEELHALPVREMAEMPPLIGVATHTQPSPFTPSESSPERLSRPRARGGDASAAAAMLGVHEHTVAYRLRTIEERLGRPVTARRVELETARLQASSVFSSHCSLDDGMVSWIADARIDRAKRA